MLRLPPETALARICIRILWLSTSLMIGKGTELQFPVIPDGNLCSGYSSWWKHENTPCVTDSSGAPERSHSQTFSQTRLHVRHLIFWEEKVTEVKLERHWNWACAGWAGIHPPSGMASTTLGLSCPKNTELNTQSVILGAHFRGSFCWFTQMTRCKTGATSVRTCSKSSSRRKLEWVCPCNNLQICHSPCLSTISSLYFKCRSCFEKLISVPLWCFRRKNWRTKLEVQNVIVKKLFLFFRSFHISSQRTQNTEMSLT